MPRTCRMRHHDPHGIRLRVVVADSQRGRPSNHKVITMPIDPRNDVDFMKASPADQMAYLRATDPAFASASPQDQQAYLDHVRGPAPFVPDHIGVNRGPIPSGSPGYQYSTGYAGPNDAPRDSGNFYDRSTTQSGRALSDPRNFVPDWRDILMPGWSQTAQALREFQNARNGGPAEDPARKLGSLAPAVLTALVTHA